MTSTRYGAILHPSSQSRSIYVKPQPPAYATVVTNSTARASKDPVPDPPVSAATPPPSLLPITKPMETDPPTNTSTASAQSGSEPSPLESAFDALRVSDITSSVQTSLV